MSYYYGCLNDRSNMVLPKIYFVVVIILERKKSKVLWRSVDQGMLWSNDDHAPKVDVEHPPKPFALKKIMIIWGVFSFFPIPECL